MKRKILALLMTFALIPNCAYAESAYFEEELLNLKELLLKCSDKCISVPYEEIAYNTLELFADYIAEDEAKGVDEAQLKFNKQYMQELYSKTVENLSLYLSGDKKPSKVKKYDMSKFTSDFETDGKSVYSVGYGHGAKAREDIELITGVGATNIQMETGPTKIFSEIPSFSVTKSSDSEAVHLISNNSERGNFLKLGKSVSGNWFRLLQNIRVEPNTEYSFGFDIMGSLGTDPNVYMGIVNENDGSMTKKIPTVTGSWTSLNYTYMTGEDETELTVRFEISDDVNILNVDNIYFKNPHGENLIFNGDFEDTYSKKEIDKLKYDLKRAEENNISVCLLLSPHYFPDNLDESVYAQGNNGFIKFNIDPEETKTIIEEYLHIVCSELKDSKAISSICLSNEPVFVSKHWYDYYQPKFSEWLKEKYGTVEAMNKAYGEKYGIYNDFSEVALPLGWDGKCQVFYDSVDFNEEIFTKWHKWMAEIVKEYFPNTPLHTKTMNLLHSGHDNRGSMMHGANPERFDEFNDWAGNDAGIYESGNGAYTDAHFLNKMRWYDFLSSTTEKPVYNSEDHVVQNRHTDFNEEYAKQVKASLWQGFVHHNNMSTVWHWSRGYNTESDAYNSILHRPDCIYNVGEVALDANRLSEKLDRINGKKPKVGLYYSEASRVYNSSHCSQNLVLYEDLLTLGQSVGFVTEMNLDKMQDYDIIVIGNTPNTTTEAAIALEEFARCGGLVVLVGDNNLKGNEYNQTLNCSLKGSVSTTFENFKTDFRPILKQKGLQRVEIVDATTKEPTDDVEWQFDVDKTGVVINVFALEEDHDVEIYLDGKKLTNLTDMLTGEKFESVVPVEEFVPRLLQNPVYKAPKEVDIVSVDGKTVTWENDDEAYKYAYIYRMNEENKPEFVERVSGYSYTCKEGGVIIIKAVDSYENESFGRAVNITQDTPPEIGISEDGKEAFVENTTNKAWSGELAVHLKDSNGRVKSSVGISALVNPGDKISIDIPFTPVGEEYIDVETVNN